MEESISIEHRIQYFRVTKEPKTIRSKSGKGVMLTEGVCTTELPRTCPECGGTLHVHDHQHVFIQDFELFGNLSLLKVGYARMECRRCKEKLSQEVPFRAKSHMLTTRLETRVCRRLNQGSTLKATSAGLGIHPSIIKGIDKERLRSRSFLTRPEHAANIGIDEFLLHKGHRYATVVIDLDRKRVIFLEEGKKKEQAEHFIRRMDPAWMSHVKAVSMDMNAQYDSAFRESAPHVAIVYDRFHMVKLFNDSVLTAIRRRLQTAERLKVHLAHLPGETEGEGGGGGREQREAPSGLHQQRAPGPALGEAHEDRLREEARDVSLVARSKESTP